MRGFEFRDRGGGEQLQRGLGGAAIAFADLDWIGRASDELCFLF